MASQRGGAVDLSVYARLRKQAEALELENMFLKAHVTVLVQDKAIAMFEAQSADDAGYTLEQFEQAVFEASAQRASDLVTGGDESDASGVSS